MTLETPPGLERVSDPRSPVFRAAVDIIRQTIAADEQLTDEELLTLLARDDYRLYAWQLDAQVAGAAMLYLPEHEPFGLLDYMAVRAALQNHGLGSTLFRAAVGVVARDRPAAEFLLLEVDDNRAGDAGARSIASRRIGFYQRLDARLLANVDYLFPSHSGPPVPMRLMVYWLHGGPELSRAALQRAITAIFAGIHGRSTDDRLLQRNVDALPSHIITQDAQMSTIIRTAVSDDWPHILDVINDAAIAYKGIIPHDRWHEPYMSREELDTQRSEGVVFSCYVDDGTIVGVMGIQDKVDVDLIRHAYVRTTQRKSGVGTQLLQELVSTSSKPILIGTWKAAAWAIAFYQKHGFRLVSEEDKEALLEKYWNIPQRQVETSVVLADEKYFGTRKDTLA